MGNHSPLATLRRDMNSEYVALANHVQGELLAAREVVSYLVEEAARIRSREKVWAGCVVASVMCLSVVAAHLIGLM